MLRRLLIVMTTLALATVGQTLVSAGDFDYATGEHKFHVQIAFTAHDTPTGPVGQAKIQFEPGVTVHVRVDCLAVNGNLAALEGDVVRSSHPEVPTGGRVEIEVEDKGEASPGHFPGPDEVQVNFTNYPTEWTRGFGPDCNPNSDPFNRTRDGNVEVHDAG